MSVRYRNTKENDLSGTKVNHLQVLYPVKKNGKTYYHCRCDCGKELDVYCSLLRYEKQYSCGCQRGEQKVRDISGQRFGRLVAKKIAYRKPPKTYWLCQCDCGNTAIVDINCLSMGKTRSCGCLGDENRKTFQKEYINNLVGQRFGKLVVLRDSGKRTKTGGIKWLCKCDCGNVKEVSSTHLVDGSCNSCGCINSKGELKIQQILRSENILYTQQKTFDDCRNSRTNHLYYFDFYLPVYHCCIEYNGIQHYKSRENSFFTKEQVSDTQKRDLEKIEYCKQNNLLLVIIPYTDYEKLDWDYLKAKIGIK